ncbi:MAG: hypothetical protein QOJ09_2390 [Actinomycetota bacterium]|jgi:hypothetical protein|nr:hypothetical protein [Actinomycetota bacterium]
MAGSSFGKYERDRNKRAKAAAKRDRRQNKSSAEESTEATDLLERPPHADLSPEELLKRIEEIHRRFDEGTISYDDFEEQKQALLASLTVD